MAKPISLITRADDLGSSHAANRAIREAVDAGFVKNVSVLAVGPCLEEAAELLAGRKDVCFGLHCCLNSEWDRITWGPAAPPERVAHLIDRRGRLPQSVEELAAAAPPLSEIAEEYRSQLDRLRRAGFPVRYLDSHMLPELRLPGLRELFGQLAAEEGLVDHSPFYRFVPELDRLSTEKGLFRSCLKSMEGQYLLVMHPACYGEEMLLTGNRKNSGERVAAQREADRRFMTDPDTLAACRDFGVRLLRYDEAVV